MFPSSKQYVDLKIQTQNALRAINEYEKVKQARMITTISVLPTEANMKTIKQFTVRQKIKLQLLPYCLAYYQMQLNDKVDNKIIIRHFKGGPADIFVFFNRLANDLDKAAHHFTIRDQLIIKLEQKYFRNSNSIIIVFKTQRNLAMFTFRIDDIDAKKIRQKLKTDRSFESIDNSIFYDNQLSMQKVIRSKSEKNKSKKIIEINVKASFKEKTQQKIKRLQQRKQINLEKKQAAKRRLLQIQECKQKNKQAEKILAVCKKLFSTYSQLVKQEENKKSEIIRKHCALFYVMKFNLISTQFSNERSQKFRKQLMKHNYEKKFIKKIREAYRQTKCMANKKKHRELLVFDKIISSVGYYLNRTDKNNASRIIIDTMLALKAGLLLNSTMGYCSEYKRVVRSIQRRWKSKIEARISMLLLYAEEQIKIIFKLYPQLRAVQQQYRKANRVMALCWDYQKQTASKMVEMITAYQFKLEQIRQYQEINKQIIQHNRNAYTKKQHKQLLEIPKKPSFPTFRFFRDLSFFKSMIRSELELQFRRFKKKNPHLSIPIAPISPQKQDRKNVKRKSK